MLMSLCDPLANLPTVVQPVEVLERVAGKEPGASEVLEPYATAILLAAFGFLVAFCVVFSGLIGRLGLPVVLLFLVLGMLGGSDAIGGVEFDDYGMAMRLGTIALVLILFDGGLNTRLATIRSALAPATTLAVLGVALTAGGVTLFARLVGFNWSEAALLGAVVSSTDAAAVFAVLRSGRFHLKARVERTIELESCVNDPMAVILTVAMIELISAGQSLSLWLLVQVPMQLVLGGGIGYSLGLAGRSVLKRVNLDTVGLIPVFTLAIALLSFGIATVFWGSGFLAVYVTAVTIGNAGQLPYRSGLVRVHDAFAWLAQVAMFLMLGLLVFPKQLGEVLLPGLGIGLFLSLIARPIAVLICLKPFSYSMREIGFVGLAGLRGAVPIVLATYPVLYGVFGAERLFNLVFCIVVVSALVPGGTLRFMARLLKVFEVRKPAPPAVMEINASRHLEGELQSFFIQPELAVADASLSEIDLPSGSAVVMVVRGTELIAARGNTRLLVGDHAYVFSKASDRPLIDLLFGEPEGTGD